MARITTTFVVLSVLLLSGCPQEDAELQQEVEGLRQEIANLESLFFIGGDGHSDVLITGSVDKPCERKVRTLGFPMAWICYPGDRLCPEQVEFRIRPAGPDLWIEGDSLTFDVKSGGDPFGCFPGPPVTINQPALTGTSGQAACEYVPGTQKYWQHDVTLSNDDECGGVVDSEDPVVILRSRRGR